MTSARIVQPRYLVNADGTDVDGSNPLPCAVTDPTTGVQQSVDSLGHADVVAHAHAEGGHALFEKDISATADFIFIDISDTTNYPHDNTSWIHFGNLIIDVDASNLADYEIHLGFLSNVDATNGDFTHIYGWSGTKSAGNNIREVIATHPESVKARPSSNIGKQDLNDTAFQTDVNLASTKDPATADTPSGDGDIALRVTMNAGSINLKLGVVYHSH